MRIEMPTNSAAPKVDRESPKPEGNDEKGELTFFEVIDQASAEGDNSKQAVERAPSPPADGKELPRKETEKKRGPESEKSSTAAAPSAILTSEPYQPVIASDPTGTVVESGNTPSADGTRDAEGPDPDAVLAPQELVSGAGPASPLANVSPAGKLAPAVAASSRPGVPSLQAPGEEFKVPADVEPEDNVVVEGQTAVDAAGSLPRALSQPEINSMPQLAPTVSAVMPTEVSSETGGSQSLAKDASTPMAPGPSLDVASIPRYTSDVMDVVRAQAGALEVDPTAASVVPNDKRVFAILDDRPQAKVGWFWGRHVDSEQAEVLPQPSQNSLEVSTATTQAGQGSATNTSSGRAASPSVLPDRSFTEPQPGTASVGQGESSEPDSLDDDFAGLVAADTQREEVAIPHSETGHTSAAGMPISDMLHQVQDAESTTSTSWAAGTQAPENSAGADLKGLSALLASKPTAAFQEPDFLSQLAQRIDVQLRNGENVIQVQLKPSSLGRMEIRAETSGTAVVATIITESNGVKNYLEHTLHVLQQSFLDQGLKVDHINVTVQEGFQPGHSSSGPHDSRAGEGQQDESKSTLRHGSESESSGDELTVDTQTLIALNPHSTFHAVA
jgi:flagellar hook-length control protein FliK